MKGVIFGLVCLICFLFFLLYEKDKDLKQCNERQIENIQQIYIDIYRENMSFICLREEFEEEEMKEEIDDLSKLLITWWKKMEEVNED